MCVTSLLCGPRADLWPIYGFLCKRISLYIEVLPLYRLYIPLYRGITFIYRENHLRKNP